MSDTRAFTDPWTGLRIYDGQWQLVDAEEALQALGEYENLSMQWGTKPPEGLSAPLRAVLELTGNCNMDCAFCYNSSGNARPSFSDGDFLGVLQQLCELQVLEVVLTGGEVFVVPDRLRQAAVYLREGGVGAHIITNGWGMTPQWARFLHDAGIISVQVSIDGVDAEVHDELRRRPGAWRRAVDAVAHVAGAGCYAIMAAVVTKTNYARLEDYIDFAFSIGADQVLFGDLIPRGRGIDVLADLQITDAQYLDLLAMLRDKARQYEGLMVINIGTDEAMSLKMHLNTRPEGCLIRSDGTVTPGCLIPVSLGSLYERSLAQIWQDGFRDLASQPQIGEFLADLRVRGVGPDAVLRVAHRCQSECEDEPS